MLLSLSDQNSESSQVDQTVNRVIVEFISNNQIPFVAPVHVDEDRVDQALHNKPDFFQMQKECPDFGDIIKFLVDKELPNDDKLARKVTFEVDKYEIVNNLLFHLDQRRGKKMSEHQKYTRQLCIPIAL